MSRRGKVTIDGLKDLEKTLSTLSKATGRNVLRRALMKAAEPMAADMRGRAPVRSGDLRAGVAATTRKPHDANVGKAAYAAAMRKGLDRAGALAAMREARKANPTDFAEAFVGPGRHPQGVTQEFGTVRHPPQPFVRPAWEGGKRAALATVEGHIAAELQRAIARAERKAAREAAKRARAARG